MKQVLRTAARVVSENRLSTTRGWLPHVMQCIDNFLTGGLSHKALTAACEAGASEYTLGYIFEKTAPDWKETVKAAVRGGHMHVLHWMTGRDDGRGPWKANFGHMLELAATHGHLDVVKWIFERGIDFHTLSIGETEKNLNGSIEKSWLYRHCTADALNRAAEYGHFEVVKWIYGARTDTCSIFSSPMRRAVENRHLAIAQWLYTTKREKCSSVHTMNTAAKNGHLQVLQWLDANHLFMCTGYAMDGAAENGHLEVVKWLHQAHQECCSSGALRRAIKSGNLELVEWLYENVHIKCHPTDVFMKLDTTTAAGHGHLDVLKWTHEHFPGSFSSDDMDAAASNGHLHVITWLHENHQEGCSNLAAYNAARNGHLEVLKWLYAHYPNIFEPAVMDGAAENGNLEVVRWLHENLPEGCTRLAVYRAARNGHLDVLLYLLEHRTEGFSSHAMPHVQEIQVLCHFGPDVRGTRRSNRATSDELKMLQTLFERRLAFVRDWLQCLAHVACSRGIVAILDWVNQFGIKLTSTAPICDAVSCGDAKMLQWFFENDFEITDPDLLEVAVEDGQLEVVRWLSEHGYAVNSLKYVKIAGEDMNVPMMRWLVEHGPPLDLSTAMTLVLENHHIEIAWWVAENDRVQLVLDALDQNDREDLWWVLTHTQFQDQSAQRSIRDAIYGCPVDIQQWLEESLSEVESCRWCFSALIKGQNGEAEETGVRSSKRRRCDERFGE